MFHQLLTIQLLYLMFEVETLTITMSRSEIKNIGRSIGNYLAILESGVMIY